ncbi:hypothetical protein ABZV14_19050 [Streptosporangium canum]|uniref:hypothetical protein n=1 Tax=Streptosporangium canum TaxID=324952 RepID=UPI0033A02F56
MNDVEEILHRTFGQATGQAPRLPGQLPAHLERIHLRRRRRARMALTAAAVVLIAGGTTAVLRGGSDITTVVQGEVASGPSAVTPAEHVERVWPEAVRRIPAQAPDGASWRPVTFIDDRTLLMSVDSERTAALYAYDLEGDTQRKIAAVPVPKGTTSFPNGEAVGGGHVVWWTATKDGVAHLWAVPLEGGTPRIVADHGIPEGDDGSGIDRLAVVDDRIVFSLYVGGVFTVPLGGGTVEPVERGAGMHLLAWPWVGTPGTGGEPTGPRFARIQNVETGETRTAVTHPDEQLISCGVTLCQGSTSEGSFFRHRDGSSQKNVPGHVSTPNPPVQDRVYVSAYGDGKPEGIGLYDLDSGKSGYLGIKGEGDSISLPFTDRTDRLLSYTLGDDLYLIDLSKVR